MSAETLIAQIITAAQAAATSAQNQAVTYSNAAQTAALSFFFPGDVPKANAPTVDIPPFINPQQELGDEFRRELSNAFADLDPKLAADTQAFIDKWFPEFDGCIRDKVDSFICDTITDGFGLTRSVADAIWQRGRERELIELARRESEAVNNYASRGFMLPSGVLTNQLSAIRQDVANKAATFNRDVVIKEQEIRIESVKFAVEQGIRLRLGVITALVDFIRARIALHTLTKDRASAFVDAERALFQNAAAYYNALIDRARLELEEDRLNIARATDDNRTLADFFARVTDSRVNAAVSAARAMGDIAASALASQNSLASIDNSTIEST